MAFRKAITVQGFPETTEAYHRIVNFTANPVDKIAKIEIAVYFNEATRTANGKNYIGGKSTFSTEISEADFTTLFTGGQVSLTDLYTWIKANVVFYSDATDV